MRWTEDDVLEMLQKWPPERTAAGRAARFGMGFLLVGLRTAALVWFLRELARFADQPAVVVVFGWSAISLVAFIAGLLGGLCCALIGDRAVVFVTPARRSRS